MLSQVVLEGTQLFPCNNVSNEATALRQGAAYHSSPCVYTVATVRGV